LKKAWGVFVPLFLLSGGLLLIVGCASSPEKVLRAGNGDTHRAIYASPSVPKDPSRFDENATLETYLQHAFRHNPRLYAAFERWQAGHWNGFRRRAPWTIQR
jgi:hypothetical protein